MVTAVINEKGGVGKTTTTATLGHALARRGKRVLVLDLDPQANLTAWLGASPPRATIANVLADPTVVSEALGESRAEGLTLLYGSRDAADAADDLRASSPAPALALRRALRKVSFDVVLIDCPPQLGTLTVNALCAADHLMVPIDSQAMSLTGLSQLNLTLEQLSDAEVLQEKPMMNVVITKYDGRLALAREVRDHVRTLSNQMRVYDTPIRLATRLAECYGHHLTIFDYAPREPVAADYDALALEVFA